MADNNWYKDWYKDCKNVFLTGVSEHVFEDLKKLKQELWLKYSLEYWMAGDVLEDKRSSITKKDKNYILMGLERPLWLLRSLSIEFLVKYFCELNHKEYDGHLLCSSNNEFKSWVGKCGLVENFNDDENQLLLILSRDFIDKYPYGFKPENTIKFKTHKYFREDCLKLFVKIYNMCEKIKPFGLFGLFHFDSTFLQKNNILNVLNYCKPNIELMYFSLENNTF